MARTLLDELRASARRQWAIVDRSLELRRQAIRLTATALTLARQSERLRAELLADGSRELAARDVEGALSRVRVLLVGETPEQEEGLTLLLSALGAYVRTARSVADALEVARSFRPEVLLCDVPLAAGEGLICELRRHGAIVPAIVIGGSDSAAALSDGRAAGFADLLVRPITLGALVRAVLGA